MLVTGSVSVSPLQLMRRYQEARAWLSRLARPVIKIGNVDVANEDCTYDAPNFDQIADLGGRGDD